MMSAPGSPGASGAAWANGGVYSPTRGGIRLGSASSKGGAEEVLAAAADGELGITAGLSVIVSTCICLSWHKISTSPARLASTPCIDGGAYVILKVHLGEQEVVT